MKILIVDNFDSFTYNSEHYLKNYAEVDVIRVDDNKLLSKIINYNKIVLSPGPGLPKDRIELNKIIKKCIELKKPLLGICLGHQAIAESFGAKLFNLKEVNHGLEKNTRIIDNDIIFKNVPSNFLSARYHSWAIDENEFPNSLLITSVDDDDVIMSFKHKTLNIKGLQFHPESILTKYGKIMLKNWVNN
jgi:anthranilate synthase component 2